jgi:hypothetical protein
MLAANRETIKPNHFIVPHVQNPTFTPRVGVSRKLEALLEKGQAQDDEQRRVALYGLGGTG